MYETADGLIIRGRYVVVTSDHGPNEKEINCYSQVMAARVTVSAIKKGPRWHFGPAEPRTCRT